MKRLFVPIAVVAMMFTSCKKYEVSEELNLDSLPKVTLTGTVYANLDETTPELEFAPSGTVIRVSVPYNAYDANNNSGGFYVQTTTLDAQGKYSLEVPTVSKGVNATISFMDFSVTVKTQNAVGQVVNVLKHFTCADVTAANLSTGKLEGDHTRINATYAATTTEPNANALKPTGTVEISGKMEYLKIDSSNVGGPYTYADVPSGTKVTAMITLTDAGGRTYNETQTITITGGGTYSVKVPMVDRGTAAVNFLGEEFWEMTIVGASHERQLWRYEINSTTTAYNTQTTQTGKNHIYVEQNYVTDL